VKPSAIVGLVALVIVALFGFTWLVEGNEFFLYKFFAPKRAAVEREVFENTKSYSQGMLQELEAMLLDYNKADSNGKDSICSVVRRRTADFPTDRMPADIYSFVKSCLGHVQGPGRRSFALGRAGSAVKRASAGQTSYVASARS
jgi:hypothetical protein